MVKSLSQNRKITPLKEFKARMEGEVLITERKYKLAGSKKIFLGEFASYGREDVFPSDDEIRRHKEKEYAREITEHLDNIEEVGIEKYLGRIDAKNTELHQDLKDSLEDSLNFGEGLCLNLAEHSGEKYKVSQEDVLWRQGMHIGSIIDPDEVACED